MRRNVLLCAAFVCAGLLRTASAAGPISGTFTIDGSVHVTATGITWTSNNNVAEEATISSAGLSGSFNSSMANQTVTIHDLNNATQPVGMTFTQFDFLDFPAAFGFPSLMATSIALGSGGQADCSTNPANAAPGQTCTLTPGTVPPEPGGSPFTFLNSSYTNPITQQTACCHSSAGWNISGVTSDQQSGWTAIFNSNFTTSFQQVLQDFATNGSVSDEFGGAFTIVLTPLTPTPEPGTFVMLGLGFLGLGTVLARRKHGRA